MESDNQSIFWSGTLVGEIREAKFDNFDFYGLWNPKSAHPIYEEFLEAIDVEDGVWVAIGAPDSDLRGTVDLIPDEEINIKMRPGENSQSGL